MDELAALREELATWVRAPGVGTSDEQADQLARIRRRHGVDAAVFQREVEAALQQRGTQLEASPAGRARPAPGERSHLLLDPDADIEEAALQMLLAAHAFLAKENWREDSFRVEKAWVCCLFSQIAYLHLPRYELAESERIKVVPSELHRRLASEGRSLDLEALLSAADYRSSFLIETDAVVIVGIATRRLVVVAIRGSHELYDWVVNAKVLRRASGRRPGAARFHRGFLSAIEPCLEPLTSELEADLGAGTPIYFTGHSLGGALSAIARGLCRSLPPFAGSESVTGGYTFGMPRYGNLVAVGALPTPYHLFNARDAVATIPPRWAGYATCPREYRLGHGVIRGSALRESLGFGEWMWRLAFGGGISEHGLEVYAGRIHELLRSRREPVPAAGRR